MVLVHSSPSWLVLSEIKCTVHVALLKRHKNQFIAVQQNRQQELRAYCPDIYCDTGARWWSVYTLMSSRPTNQRYFSTKVTPVLVFQEVQVSSLRALTHVTLQRNSGVGTSIMPSQPQKRGLLKRKRPYQISVMCNVLYKSTCYIEIKYFLNQVKTKSNCCTINYHTHTIISCFLKAISYFLKFWPYVTAQKFKIQSCAVIGWK